MMEEDGGRVHEKMDSPWRTDKIVDGYKVDGGKVMWHPHGLSSPQETSK